MFKLTFSRLLRQKILYANLSYQKWCNEKWTLDLKARPRMVTYATPYIIKYVIIKAIIYIAISRKKCQFLAETTKLVEKWKNPIYAITCKFLTHCSYVAHNFIVEFCYHWIYYFSNQTKLIFVDSLCWYLLSPF